MKKSRIPPSASFSIFFTLSKKSDAFIKKICGKIQKKYNPELLFDGSLYPPHITLYLFAAPLRNKDKLLEKIIPISESVKALDLLVVDVIASEDGWVMVNLEKSKEIIRYHTSFVESLNGLREGLLRNKYRGKKKLYSLKPEERKVLIKYGDRHANQLFVPHASLAKCESEEEAQDIKEYIKKDILGKKISVGELVFRREVGRGESKFRTFFHKDLF